MVILAKSIPKSDSPLLNEGKEYASSFIVKFGQPKRRVAELTYSKQMGPASYTIKADSSDNSLT
jgi:hypothetical protein